MLITSNLVQSLPPIIPGFGGAAITGFQVLTALSSFQVETNPETTAQYSKFVSMTQREQDGMIESRDGMTIIYLPAYIATLVFLGLSAMDIIPASPSLAGVFVNVHFLKRMYEVYFVHKYSGKISGGTSGFIGVYYALLSLLICSVATPSPDMMSTSVGTALFAIGLAGNFFHHVKLSELRKDSSPSAKYVAPRGGMFECVAAPHYFFELMGWLGIAIASEHGNAFLVFASMTSYLAGRSVSQNRWNRQMFSKDDWPEDRKNIVPFLF